MGIYRKIEIAMWGDERFCTLTPLQPSGQALWIYLLTGPHTNSIPGLFKAGQASLAEELGWDLKGFGESFGELLREGLAKADTKARLIWLPKALKHNPPANPNVVKSWAKSIQFLPQCDLLKEALSHIDKEIKGYGKGYEEGLGKWYANTVNSKQEQYTEEEILSGKPDDASFSWEPLDYLCQKSGHLYHRTASNLSRLKARYRDGYCLEDFKLVIDHKASEWSGKDDFKKYLRPETIFGTKFDTYLAQAAGGGSSSVEFSRSDVPEGYEDVIAAVRAANQYD